MHLSNPRTRALSFRSLAWSSLLYRYIGLLGCVWVASAAAAPTVTSITPPADGLYGAPYVRREHWVGIPVTFSEPITVTGGPTLQVTIGGVTRQANTLLGVNGRTAIFGLTPDVPDNGALSITGPILLNGGTIRGEDGADASLAFTPVNTPGVIIDMVAPAAPVIAGVTPTRPNSEAQFTVAGTAELGTTVQYTLDNRVTGSAAVDASGNWSVTLGPVAAGEHNFSATAKDRAGNTPGFPGSMVTGVRFTVVEAPAPQPPTIARIDLPVANTYFEGQNMLVGLSFSAPVQITGNPVLNVTVGADTRSFTYYSYSASAGNVAYFYYQVTAADLGALTITGPVSLNGGSIRRDGLDASLAFESRTTGVIMNTPPAIAQVSPASPTTTEPVTVSGTALARMTIVYKLDEAQSGTTEADASGNWSVTLAPITAPGEHVFTAHQRSIVNNSQSTSTTFTVRTGAPPAPTQVVSPPPAQPGSPPAPPPPETAAALAPVTITQVTPVAPTATETFTLSGTAEPNAILSCSLDQGLTGTLIVDGGGNWSTVLGPVAAGEHVFEINLQGTAGAGLPPASLRFTVQAAPVVVFPATITAIEPPVAGLYADGETITLAVRFSADVTVTGVPSLEVRVGATPQQAIYTTSIGNTLYFEYQPVAGVTGTLDITGPLALNGGAIRTGEVDAALVFSPVVTDVVIARAPAVAPASRLVNVSTRVQVADGNAERTLIMGFVIRGGGQQRLLVRGVGPSLAGFGVQSPLPDPRVRLLDNQGRVLQENDDWSGESVTATASRVGAFPMVAGSRDAALVQELSAGPYTLHATGNGGTGIALAEIFDASDAGDPARPGFANLSARGYVGTGQANLGAGFVIAGSQPMRVLIRGIGPALTAFGVGEALADPVLTLYKGSAQIAQNDNWETSAGAAAGVGAAATVGEISAASSLTGAFALTAGARDAVLLVTLEPGDYTAYVSGVNGGTGVGLVEIYELREAR